MENQKKKLILGVIAGLLIIGAIVVAIYCISREDAPKNDDNSVPIAQVMMPLYVYVQNKEKAATSNCSATMRVLRNVPKSSAVADTSLKILFSDELAEYGVYKTVTLSNGVAKVMLESDRTRAGAPLSSLSSCQSGHLLSVLRDTLLQYKSIQTVELHTPSGVVEF